MPPADFWGVTPREAAIIIEAATARESRILRQAQGVAYSQSMLFAYATHDPKKMPDFDKVFPDGKPKQKQSDEEIAALMAGWVKMYQVAGAK